MSEDAFHRIMHKTGRKPVECKCQSCRSQCKTPCLGTPDDIISLMQAGYGGRLKLSYWCVGMLLGKIDRPIPMVQAIQTEEGCTFFRDGLCEIHDKGLKPTEGRLSYHTITKETLKFTRTLSWNVVREWLLPENADKVIYLLNIYQDK